MRGPLSVACGRSLRGIERILFGAAREHGWQLGAQTLLLVRVR